MNASMLQDGLLKEEGDEVREAAEWKEEEHGTKEGRAAKGKEGMCSGEEVWKLAREDMGCKEGRKKLEEIPAWMTVGEQAAAIAISTGRTATMRWDWAIVYSIVLFSKLRPGLRVLQLEPGETETVFTSIKPSEDDTGPRGRG
eukprot:747660-Hanusia_phi.AAC.1